jgi:thiamine biosynthesis lipoprotein
MMKLFLIGVSVLISFSLISCSPAEKKVMFQGQTQGTYYAVTYFDTEGRNFQEQIDSILRAFDLSVSMWVPESIISRINGGDSLVQPDDWFIDIFKRSQEIAAKTGGAFDCTVGPLVDAWGFGFKGKIKMDQAKVDSLLQYVDYRKVELDDRSRIIKPDGIRFDFNAIAQGYAVDVLGNYLALQGIRNYLVDIGGEVLGKGGKPDGQPWLVGIEDPTADSLSDRSINTRVKLMNKAMATSGNYRKYYEENGIRYSHAIDPHTGYPVRHSLLSVSVLADDCATADGYATAFMVMGFGKARAYVENEPGLEAFFIVDGGSGTFQTYATKGLEEIIKKE